MIEEDRTQIFLDREALIEALENIEVALIGEVQEFKPDDDSLDIEAAVKTYLLLRESREKGKDRQDARDKQLRAHQTRIEQALGAFMQRNTSTGLNTRFGTVFTSQQSTARVADKEAFLSFLLEKDLPEEERNGERWNNATIAANKASVGTFIETNDGVPPPGVDWSSRIVVQIRRK